jgi:hypothetical protein
MLKRSIASELQLDWLEVLNYLLRNEFWQEVVVLVHNYIVEYHLEFHYIVHYTTTHNT